MTIVSSTAIVASQRLRDCCASASALSATSDAAAGADSRWCSSRGSSGSVSTSDAASAKNRRSQRAKADLVLHPALEERLRRHPQVEIGIELAAEALDVQQRLLQQHELRLDLAR